MICVAEATMYAMNVEWYVTFRSRPLSTLRLSSYALMLIVTSQLSSDWTVDQIRATRDSNANSELVQSS
jgi:hypothetical protein